MDAAWSRRLLSSISRFARARSAWAWAALALAFSAGDICQGGGGGSSSATAFGQRAMAAKRNNATQKRRPKLQFIIPPIGSALLHQKSDLERVLLLIR